MGQAVEQCAKGSLVLGAVITVRRHRKAGRITSEQLEARLSPGALEMLEEKIDIGRWYPIQILCELLDLDWEVGGLRDPDYLRKQGEEAAERLFQQGIYEQLDYAKRLEPAQARDDLVRRAKLITSITGALYNFLTGEVRLDDDREELQICYRNAAAFSEALRYVSEGFMNQLNKRQNSSLHWSSERVRPDLVVFTLKLGRRLGRTAHPQYVEATPTEGPTAKHRIDRLSFIFDANSGLGAALLDSVRKVIRLNGCDLCTITHGITGEKKEMASCRESLGVPVDYVHRDEMDGAMIEATGNRLPAVVAHSGSSTWLVLDRDIIARCKGSVGDLRGRLNFYAAKLGLVLPDAR
jgi:hypothetical protein